MIILTKLDGTEIMLNEEFIEAANETPDTVLVMNNGHTYIVTDTIDEIMQKITDFRRMTRRRAGAEVRE